MSGQQCEAVVDFLGIVITCGQPAAGQYRRACVHEHVRDGWLCQAHVSNPLACCLTCYELPVPLGHVCPATLTPLDEAAP